MTRLIAYCLLLIQAVCPALASERLRLGPTSPLPLQIVGAAFETADGDLRTVPVTATAASLNVTVVNPTGEGYLTVWPCGVKRPLASNINFTSGSIVPNGVLAPLGGDGAVCLFSSVVTDVIVDVSGWFNGDVFAGSTPTRLLDTRLGLGAPQAKTSPAAPLAVPVGGLAVKGALGAETSIPSAVRAVALNVTVVNPEAAGYVTLWPCGTTRPEASNLNFEAGQVIANGVLAPVGRDGSVCAYSSVPTDLLVDLAGWFPGELFAGVTPVRLLDSREGGGRKLAAGRVAEVLLKGRTLSTGDRVPTTASAVSLNVTVTGAEAPGYLTVWPCGMTRPEASNVNFAKGQTVANNVLAPLGTSNGICIYTSATTDVIVDIAGWVRAGTSVAAFSGTAPKRMGDTRLGFWTTAEQTEAPDSLSSPLVISASGLKRVGASYEAQRIEISANLGSCRFALVQGDAPEAERLIHLRSEGGRVFSFRNPIVYEGRKSIGFKIATLPSPSCPQASQNFSISVERAKTVFDDVPHNQDKLITPYYQVGAFSFGGIVIRERYDATICYPTPDDCRTDTDQLFGSDAHNMAVGDFNGDGLEDFVVAWVYFPHTIELDQKVAAPLSVFLNLGDGRFEEDLTIFAAGERPTHPFAYRTIVGDFNGDGLDDIFAGSMGLQYRSATESYILPYPHLLLVSNAEGKLEDRSAFVEDRNNGEGPLCGFAHDASSGDPDGDGDTDLFACGILLENDGLGNFTIHRYVDENWRGIEQLSNPMSSLLTDLNNDGFDDILVWNFDNRSQWSDADEGYIYLSNGSPDIESWSRLGIPHGPFGFDNNKYNFAASGDLNGDGFNDVVVAITRPDPYYEGAYLQILINNGQGALLDETARRFPNQPRAEAHHGEGNLYLRDMNGDGITDIIHSTRDYKSAFDGAHIAINDGAGNFDSIQRNRLPRQPQPNSCQPWQDCVARESIEKALPIDADKEGCLDFISTAGDFSTPPAFGQQGNRDERIYLYTVINKRCDLPRDF